MKKRTIISILLSITCVVITCNLWCRFLPYEVSFDIKGAGEAEIVVYLSKVNSPDFDKTKWNKDVYSLDKTSKIDVELERVRFPKRFKICITRLNHPSNKQVQISNIQFRNGTYKIDDLDKFKVTGAKNVRVNNGVLSFESTEDLVTIYYDKKLDAPAQMYLNLKLFVIILVLSFLLLYKITDYLADFKSVQHKSRLDIIFLLLFFVIIIIPMLRVNMAEQSEAENRTLAKFIPLMNDKKEVNQDFGKNFDSWFSDRFFLRDKLITVASLKEIINGRINNEFVMSGKGDWLFFKGDDSIDNYRNNTEYSQKDLKKIATYLSEVNDYCKRNNKVFIVVVPPDKHRIYEEYYPTDLVKKVKPDTESKTIQLFTYMAKNTDVNMLYLKDAMTNAKGEDVLYFKKDTHWNALGSYAGYKAFIKALNKLVPSKIDTFKPQKMTTQVYEMQDLVKFTPKLLQEPDKTVYNIPESYAYSKCEVINNDRLRDYYCLNGEGKGKYTVTTYRDSFTGYLENYYSYSFKKVYYKWRYNIKASELKDSDIVVLEILERFLPKLASLQFEGGN